jgi:hypothetical protein
MTADFDFYYLYADRHTGYTGFYAYWQFKVRNGSKGTELAGIPITHSGYRMDWGYCGAGSYYHWFPSVSRVLSLSAGTYNIYIAPSGYADSTMDYANCSTMHFRMKRIL